MKFLYAFGQLCKTYKYYPRYHTAQTDKNSFPSYPPAKLPRFSQYPFCLFSVFLYGCGLSVRGKDKARFHTYAAFVRVYIVACNRAVNIAKTGNKTDYGKAANCAFCGGKPFYIHKQYHYNKKQGNCSHKNACEQAQPRKTVIAYI